MPPPAALRGYKIAFIKKLTAFQQAAGVAEWQLLLVLFAFDIWRAIMFVRFLAVALALMASATFAQAERRVALVIGNTDYKHTVKLPNARNDADSMSRMLRAEGFKVISGTDLSKQTMGERFSDFAAAAADAEVAMFFYSGHAIQIAGRNLMIPVDADIKSEILARTQTLDVDEMMAMTMSSAKAKIVLLDACRDNPFEDAIKRSLGPSRSISVGSKGLAEMRPTEGSLVVYATSPGQTAFDGKGGQNSPFTSALLKHLPAPGVEVNVALTKVRSQVQEETGRQQLPWASSSMTGLFYLSNKPFPGVETVASLTPPTAIAAASAAASQDRDGERILWKSAEELKNADGYRLYIDRYPGGEFTDMAKLKLASLSGGTRSLGDAAAGEAGTQQTEDALNLDRDAWREVQKKLSYSGHKLSADGKVGDGTREAIKSWQSGKKYTSTGYLTQAQLDVLKAVPTPAVVKNNDDDDEKPVRRSARSNSGGNGGGGGGGGIDASQAIGAAIAIGGGIALGRAFGRR